MSEQKLLPRNKTSLFKNQWFFLLIAEVVLAVITGIVNPRFFSVSNLMNILEQIAVLGIVSSGMTMLIITGEIDISVGANIGITACVMAMLMNASLPGGYFIPIVVGIALAVLNSLMVGATSIAFRAPSFITSLAFISVFKGIALALTKGSMQTIYGMFETVGTTRLGGTIP